MAISFELGVEGQEEKGAGWTRGKWKFDLWTHAGRRGFCTSAWRFAAIYN